MALSELRRHNLALVLASIGEHGPISRSEISARAGLTRGGLTRLVADLVASGLVCEQPSIEHGVGRPRTMLSLNPDRWAVASVDLRVDRTILAIEDLQGHVLASCALRLAMPASPEAVLGELETPLNELLRRAGRRTIGLGAALPGAFSTDHEIVTQSDPLGWRDVRFAAMLTTAFGLPTFTEDVATCAAIANSWNLGSGSGALLHIQVGVGAGAGLATNGAVRDPSLRHMGSIGHTPLGDSRFVCQCGRVACLDATIGFPAFVARTEHLGVHLGEGPGEMEAYSSAIASLASLGNEAARHQIGVVSATLARVISVLVAIEKADHVTIGGYPVALGRMFRDVLVSELARYAPLRATLVESSLGDTASLRGAAAAARVLALSSEHLLKLIQ